MESKHLHVWHCLVSLAHTKTDNLVLGYISQSVQPVAVSEAAVSWFFPELFISLIATVPFPYWYLLNTDILSIVSARSAAQSKSLKEEESWRQGCRKMVQHCSRSSKKEKKWRINRANTSSTREEIFQTYMDCRQKERSKYTGLGE